MAFENWSDQRLRQTAAYLKNAIDAGHPDIYDKEEERLQLDDINREIARRKSDDEDDERFGDPWPADAGPSPEPTSFITPAGPPDPDDPYAEENN